MLHVVIADDENRICRLIRMLGHWEQFGMQVDGMASNGQEAIDLLTKNHTDILITDIRMPGLSGLELIARARGLNPELRFIVISGYADFSYAQEAISLGVSGYLLKPVNEQELNDTLEKIASEIGTKNEREHALRTAVQENEENLDKVKAALALDLIHGIERDYSAAALQKQKIAVVLFSIGLSDSLAIADRLIRVENSGNWEEYRREDFGRLSRNIPWISMYR